MWLLSYTHLLALAVVAGTEAERSGTMSLPQPISSRQTYFSIPFQVDQPALPANRAAAVQLHVSTDRGKTWSQYTSVSPAQAHFMFRAPRDGEYSFGVRTLDRSNQLRPIEIDRPGLIVLVDTSPPELTLQARQGESGQVTAEWQVADNHLDRNSLTILYRSGPNLPWLTVATERQEADPSQSTWSGAVSWMPVSGPGPLEVRAEIADTAGNRDISYAQVDLERKLNTLAASVSAGSQSASDAFTRDTQDTRDRFTAGGQPPVSTPGDDSNREDRFDGWRAAAKERPSDTYAADTYAANPVRHGESDYSMPGSGRSDSFQPDSFPPDRSISVRSNPPIRNQFTTSPDPNSLLGRDADSPPQTRSRMVNSRLFELGYDVDAAGHASPARVDLWGTRDEGRTWRSYGTDEDGRSPILATVDAEGTYGFRISVSSSRDPVGRPPRPGDASDMIVTVDLTEPTARILSAERAAHNSDGRITVRWDAGDANLAQRPISLYHALYPGGPWNPVAQDLENTGQYEWLAPKNVPDRIYLRLEVRDKAGNVGISATTEPIVLSDRQPGVNVIRPNDESAGISPKRYDLR